MIRCVRIWTNDAGDSEFEEGTIDLSHGERGDHLSQPSPAQSVSFRETQPGRAFAWHDAPARQLVVTLAGTLEFTTRAGATFTIRPGDILLAEDTSGSGHRWRLVDDQPWRRAYVILGEGADPHFQRN